jgi:membrane-associated PAP2 superfamily phosphatase
MWRHYPASANRIKPVLSWGLHDQNMRLNHKNRAVYKLWLLWVAVLLITLVWDWTGWDRSVMHWWGTPQGFALQNHPFFEIWLHDHLRTAGWIVYGSLWAWALVPNTWRQAPRAESAWLMLWVSVNLMVISLLKNMSQTSCPWSMSDWGGVATYVSHWQWGMSDGGPGHCFPGGHASAAWAFVPWVLAAWWPVSATALSRNRWWVTGVLLMAALVTGVTQTLRGAHYPSHTAWTALICSGISLIAWSCWHWKHQHTQARLLVVRVKP